MGEALTIGARHERGYPIVTVAGEVDIATAARLRERLFELAGNGRPLVADLDQVRFIDSAGLAALVGAAKRATAHGGSLHVVCGRPQVRQLFRLTGLDRRLPPARTLDEVLDALMAVRVTVDLDPATYTELNRWVGGAAIAVNPDFPRLPLAKAIRAMIHATTGSEAVASAVIEQLRQDQDSPGQQG